jgi:hypothetical protein
LRHEAESTPQQCSVLRGLRPCPVRAFPETTGYWPACGAPTTEPKTPLRRDVAGRGGADRHRPPALCPQAPRHASVGDRSLPRILDSDCPFREERLVLDRTELNSLALSSAQRGAMLSACTHPPICVAGCSLHSSIVWAPAPRSRHRSRRPCGTRGGARFTPHGPTRVGEAGARSSWIGTGRRQRRLQSRCCCCRRR